MLGAVTGSLRLVIKERQRMVEQTENGRRFLSVNKYTLQKSGYLDYRKNMLQIAHLHHMQDFDDLEALLIPQSATVRREFLHWLGITRGMQVLEAGCGSGTFLFSTGLAEQVGRSGHVVGIDPATGMLAHAELTRRLYGIDWVSFKRAEVENIPFADQSFDAVVGVAFLQFSDLHRAVNEMARITKNGGFVASLHPLEPDDLPDFYQQWFQPILDLEAKFAPFGIKAFPKGEEVANAFSKASLSSIETKNIPIHLDFHDPDKATEFFIYGLGIFQELLAQVPWQARLDLIHELKKRGEAIKARYHSNELIFPITVQMVKGFRKE